MPLAKQGIVHTPQAYVLNTLGFEGFDNVGSVAAGVPNTTVQSHLCFPSNYKIAKIAISYAAVNAVDGTHKVNLVVGGLQGQTAQAYTAGNIAANDNSYTHNAANAVGSDNLGFPTNIATVGQSVFSTDIAINPADATYGASWTSATTTGGYGVFVPPNYDAVYPAGVPISLRVVTPATTGSITNLRVLLCLEPFALRAGPAIGSTVYQVVPGTDF